MAATPSPHSHHAPAAQYRKPLVWLLALGLTLGFAQAQQPPLEGLLPGTTVVAFHAAPASGDLSVLDEVFARLDTESAGDTLMRLMRVLGADMADLTGNDDLDVVALLFEELAMVCPAAEAAWDEEAAAGLLGPSVLAISVSPFSPLPGALALARPADAVYAATVQDTLIDCFADGPTLQQDDVTLHILGDGSDLPLVVARLDGTFMAATDPDLVRAAIRLASGSSEPSHLDSPIGHAAASIMDGGLGVTFDFAALAAGLDTFTAMVATDPVEEALLERALQTLASLGGAAGRITIDPDGLRLDGLMTPDASAGDAALAALIACSDCAVGTSPLLPAGASAVSGRYVDLQAIVAWLDGILAEVGPLVGETLDVRGLVAEFLGLDLDALLLDWIGTRWHSAQLGVFGTDVRSWIVGSGSVTTVPVTSEAAAREAIGSWRALLEGDAELGFLLEELLDELMFMVDPFGAGRSDLPFADGGLLAAREVDYRGVTFERWRIGPTTDVGLLVLDGHLLIGTPANSLRAAIDVHLGGPDAASDAIIGPALRALPSDASAYVISDVARQLRALADISDVLAAPLATGLSLAVSEAMSDPWGDPWGEDSWDDWGATGLGSPSGLWRQADRYGSSLMSDVRMVQSLTVPGFMRSTISDADVLPNGDRGLVFELQDLIEGSDVMIEMIDPERSWDMDTYLYLYDVGAGRIIADNDDAPDTNRSELVFTVEAGVQYAVIASSWGGSDLGVIELTSEVLRYPEGDEPATPDEAMADTVEPDDIVDAPTFAELVAMLDIVTDGLHGVAARVGLATSVTVVEDGVLRTTVTVPLR